MFSYEETTRLHAKLMNILIYNHYTEKEVKEAEKLLKKALKEVQEK